MYPIRNIVLAVCVLFPGIVARAADQTAVKELLDKVTKAFGGADQSAKLSAIKLKGKTTISERGVDLNIAFDASVQGLETLRMEMEGSSGGKTRKITMVSSGGKVWVQAADTGQTEDVTDEVGLLYRQFLTAMRGSAHPVGLNDKGFKLAHGGEGKVNDKDAVILRVGRKESNDITIYFDKMTGLPLKTETSVPGPGGRQFMLEFRYFDFKPVNGVQHPHRVKFMRDGKEVAEFEFSDIKVDQKFDASTFEKP